MLRIRMTALTGAMLMMAAAGCSPTDEVPERVPAEDAPEREAPGAEPEEDPVLPEPPGDDDPLIPTRGNL